jgi:hypothetical protein
VRALATWLAFTDLCAWLSPRSTVSRANQQKRDTIHDSMRRVLVCTVLAGCHADDPGVPRPTGTGPLSTTAAEDPGDACPCENIGDSQWDSVVSMECLCENFECPVDGESNIFTQPDPFLRITQFECPVGFVVIRQTNGWTGVDYTFQVSGEQSSFAGIRYFYDYPAFCGSLSVAGGELPPLAECEPCILSHRELVAPPGECLDREQLPEVNEDNPQGLGGEAGGPSAGGSPFK